MRGNNSTRCRRIFKAANFNADFLLIIILNAVEIYIQLLPEILMAHGVHACMMWYTVMLVCVSFTKEKVMHA